MELKIILDKVRSMMKVLISICIIFLPSACTQTDGKNRHVESSTLTESLNGHDNIISNKDTLIENFHIHYKVIELSNSVINKEGKLSTGENVPLEYYNRVVDVDLKYRGKNILDKKIDKNDFTSIIPKDNLNEFQIWNFYIEEVSNNNITFSVSVCVPDTDNCYFILYTVSETGNVQISEEEVEWEE